MPKLIALRESPVARETSAIPPRPMVIASEAASTRLVRSLSSPASRSNLCLMAFSLSSMPHSLAHSLPLYNLYFLTTPKWRYSASLSQTPSPVDHFSYLDHVRHLLTGEAALDNLGLRGGVDYWLQSNVQEMQKNAKEVRDHNNPAEVRQLLVDVIYYLDGKCAPQELKNAGVTLGPENTGIAHAATVSLLDCALLQNPPAHLTHVGTHLKGIAYAPVVTPQQQSRAVQINSDLNNVKAWLLQVRSDALKLVAMNDTQLMQAQNLRNDMATQAEYVVGGRVDPATQALEPGVDEICDSITLLASFEVTAYKA